MNIIEINGNIILDGVKDFHIGQTLECGQCFRFHKLKEEEYLLIANKRILRINQHNDSVTFYDMDRMEYEDVWRKYFDLDKDYSLIKGRLLDKDSILKEAIDAKYGVHILNQDFFETLISFIISQNKQIPHIKQIIEMISIRYGEYLGSVDNKKYYSFPSVDRLSMVTEDEFRECKVGFRAPYLVDACKKVKEGVVNKQNLDNMNTEEALANLLTIRGVGEKIGNCVLLFGLGRSESFPVDVWIKRVMENLYFHKQTKKEDIQAFAKEQFGEYGGYAQQYLFYYGRDMKMRDIEY